MYKNLPEHPMGILDLAGLAFRFWRRNMIEIARFLLEPSIVVAIVGLSFEWVISYGATMIKESRNLGTSIGLVALFAFDFMVFLLVWWWLSLRLLAIIRWSLGFSPSLADARTFIAGQKWKVIGIYGLLTVFLAVIVFACTLVMASGYFVPGVLRGVALLATISIGALGNVASVIIYMVAHYLAFSLLACEKLPFWETFGRCMYLLFRNFRRSISFGMVFFLIFIVVSTPLNLPVVALMALDQFKNGLENAAAHAQKASIYVMVLEQIWEAFIGILLRPLALIGWGYFYYDIRMRSEGLDLREKLKALDTKAA